MAFVNVSIHHRSASSRGTVIPISGTDNAELLYQKVCDCDCEKPASVESSETGKPGTWSVLAPETYTMPLAPLVASFNYKYIMFRCGPVSPPPVSPAVINPFQEMMVAASRRKLPKPQPQLTRKNELFNNLRKDMEERGALWSASVADSEGTSILQVCLVYI